MTTNLPAVIEKPPVKVERVWVFLGFIIYEDGRVFTLGEVIDMTQDKEGVWYAKD